MKYTLGHYKENNTALMIIEIIWSTLSTHDKTVVKLIINYVEY